MTFTLILTLNIVLDVAILGALAFVMSHSRKLTPHGESAPATVAPATQPARERARSGRRPALRPQLD